MPHLFFFVRTKNGLFDLRIPRLKTEKSILAAIAYFDMFRYPVTSGEIRSFMTDPITEAELARFLFTLVSHQHIFLFDGFYSLHNDPSLAARRRKGNEQAENLLKIAYRIGHRLYGFPFVRGIGISGSLSKNYADADADIDFFIITAPGYLWIARTLLHGLKKLSFITGKQHWYCMNYFIDEDALTIAEKNIFTATEVVTLKPVCGKVIAQDFNIANDWSFAMFPNREMETANVKEDRSNHIKKFFEKLFSNTAGRKLDDYLLRITAKRWKEKENAHKLNSKGNPLSLIAGKHFSRPNPEHFQQKVLQAYKERVEKIERTNFTTAPSSLLS